MNKTLTKHLSLVLLICMLFSVLGTACNVENGGSVEDKIEDLVIKDTSNEVDTGGIMGR